LRSSTNRCWQEIEDIVGSLQRGHSDVQGLSMALADWWVEMQLIQDERKRGKEGPPEADGPEKNANR
jgi:hypothetical protein